MKAICGCEGLMEKRMSANIHSTAIVMPGAQVDKSVTIGPFCIIGEAAQIAKGSEVEAYCEIGVQTGVLPLGPVTIGPNLIICSGSVIHQNSVFENGLKTGHRVTLREEILAGDGLQVGTQSDIQGHCEIGQHVCLHSNVHISQRCKVGNFVWIFPYVVLTNDPHPPSQMMDECSIQEFAVVAKMSTVLPGRIVGRTALVTL